MRQFYDFSGKVVLYVGAGGGQLLDTSVQVKKLMAIDRDRASLGELRERAEVVVADFADVAERGDVVYLEFCLHEMGDPEKALRHASKLAPEIVVYDHLPDSEWIYYGGEEEAVRRSAQAIESFGVRRRQAFSAEQRFGNHAELLAKVAPQGALAVERARRFLGATSIGIEMRYGAALL